ncbi:Gnt-II system L-idonate transporter IdnT [Enterobacter cancerogenus]|uniref:Gnt-II system L-idonate transporter IdnT n=1 Tax=Enterobacter cancerogenus TaxID=69218 RepID=A0A484YCT5_9ENTR|nr:Gnt-II system L-idonate transporter IdnT [Enterobacter cancerogenus]
MATLIAVLIAMFTFGLNRGRSMDQINDTLTSSIKIIAMMLLIIGGGGAFKQVLVDSGVDKYIASMMHATNLSPLFMAWFIAAVLRIALGSATVAAITAGGIVAPLIATTGVSPRADGYRGRFRQRDFLPRQRSGLLAVQGVLQPDDR